MFPNFSLHTSVLLRCNMFRFVCRRPAATHDKHWHVNNRWSINITIPPTTTERRTLKRLSTTLNCVFLWPLHRTIWRVSCKGKWSAELGASTLTDSLFTDTNTKEVGWLAGQSVNAYLTMLFRLHKINCRMLVNSKFERNGKEAVTFRCTVQDGLRKN